MDELRTAGGPAVEEPPASVTWYVGDVTATRLAHRLLRNLPDDHRAARSSKPVTGASTGTTTGESRRVRMTTHAERGYTGRHEDKPHRRSRG